MSHEIIRYASKAAQAEALAGEVAAALSGAVAAKGRATLAVPGGTTPGPFLEALSSARIPWASIAVMLTDERFVPESSERSNTRLLRAALLQGEAEAAQLVPFYAPAEAPEDVMEALTKGITPHLPLDVAVLGMGEDMHTASLFPGADLLNEALAPDAPPLLPMRAPGAPEPRLTLTAPVLQAAGARHLLITGPAKMAAFEQAAQPGPTAPAPVRCLMADPCTLRVHHAP